MNDEVRNLLNRLDKPTIVKSCVECGYILTTDDVPDSCPRCKRIVESLPVIISCSECGATADYDTPCPDGCDPLGHYLNNSKSEIRFGEGEFDILNSISLSEVIELIKATLEDEE